MYNNTLDSVLNGILRNPLSNTAALKAAVAEVTSRLEAGTLDDKIKVKLVHALAQVKERLDG